MYPTRSMEGASGGANCSCTALARWALSPQKGTDHAQKKARSIVRESELVSDAAHAPNTEKILPHLARFLTKSYYIIGCCVCDRNHILDAILLTAGGRFAPYRTLPWLTIDVPGDLSCTLYVSRHHTRKSTRPAVLSKNNEIAMRVVVVRALDWRSSGRESPRSSLNHGDVGFGCLSHCVSHAVRFTSTMWNHPCQTLSSPRSELSISFPAVFSLYSTPSTKRRRITTN